MRLDIKKDLFKYAVFTLFIAAVFMLFVIVHNAFLNNSFGNIKLINFTFFIVLLLGGAMFFFSIQNVADQQKTEQDISTTASTDLKIETENTVLSESKDETDFDTREILPVGAKTLVKYAEELLKNMSKEFNFVQGIMYVKNNIEDEFTCIALYAYFSDENPSSFKMGETLPGQAAKSKKIINIQNIPENYMTIVSGLGKGAPSGLVFVPFLYKDEVVAVIEYATFNGYSERIGKELGLVADKAAHAIVKLNKN